MTQRSVIHAAFTIERRYSASPARVFRAFADPTAKARWFSGPDDWQQGSPELDFRVGGREVRSGGPAEGPVHVFTAVYQDIVQDERILYTYDMRIGDERISVSLATIEMQAIGSGTKLTFTENGAFLDGYEDPAEREHGTQWLLDKLDASLSEPVTA